MIGDVLRLFRNSKSFILTWREVMFKPNDADNGELNENLEQSRKEEIGEADKDDGESDSECSLPISACTVSSNELSQKR